MRLSLITVGLLALTCLSFTGCSGEEALVLPESSLEGTITYKGQPVPYALVVVTGTGQSAQGFADENGKYKVEHVPPGSVQIAVNTDAGKGNMMSAVMAAAQGDKKSAPPKFVDVPAKYFDPTASGIQTTVSNADGANTFDIKLD